MGPVKGGPKKRRKTDRKVEPDHNFPMASSASSDDGSDDWFDFLARKINCELNLTPSMGLDLFQTIFNMSRTTFEYICSLVRLHMLEKTHFSYNDGRPMSLRDQVALALRRLSSGSSLIQIGDEFGVHHSTVSQVTWRFVEAMEMNGRMHVGWPTDEGDLADIKSKFELIQGLPNCCGAIDITHILLLLSGSEPLLQWRDRMDNHSMILVGVVDPKLRFLEVVTGLPGKLSDMDALRNTLFWDKCMRKERLNGEKVKLSENAEVQEYVIGDSGFPLMPFLMTPYQGRNLPAAKAEFNKQLVSTHIVVQRAFARLKRVWKMIDGVMWRPDKHKLPRFIFVCCILHNIIIDMEDVVLDTMMLTEDHDPGYEDDRCYLGQATAVATRDTLCQYLSGRVHPHTSGTSNGGMAFEQESNGVD